MASLGDLMLRLGVDLSAFNTAMAEIGPKVQQAAREAEKAWAPLETIGTSLLGVGAGLTAAVTAPLVGVGAAAVSLSEQLNMARLSFTTMLGDGQKANQFLRELADFAAKTPFEFPDLVEAARRMQAMGFESGKVLPTLRSIGDAAAALGQGKEFINGVTTALGQMQAKGKVSAEEMNQLAERGIPAWKFLADAIGIGIPEAMKLAEQGAIKGSEAIPAILAGMNAKFAGQMAQASETLTGKWSNFKDTVSMTLADLGNTLTPILSRVLDLMNPILQWAKDAAQWFANLPTPVQNAALAFGALLAAAGPIALAVGGVASAVGTLMPLLAPLGAAIGVGTGALLGWAAAIPVAVAALVGLGTWVYQNWEAIKAVIFTAWDGVQEMWAGFWGPIVGWITGIWQSIANAAEPIFSPLRTFFGAIWTGIDALFSGIWTGIKNTLVGIWEGIKASADFVWRGIAGAFQTFIEWAQKIPGVNKLMNLDDAWNSAKKLSEETKKAAEQTKNLKEKADAAAGGAGKPLPKLAFHLDDTAKKAKKAKNEFIPLKAKGEELRETAKQLEEQHRKHVETLVALKLKLEDAKNATVQMLQPTEELNAAVSRIAASAADAKNQVTFFGDALNEQVNKALQPTRDLDAAYAQLGITSAATMQTQATKAREAYDKIKADSGATVRDVDAAWVAYETARIEAARAMGQTIPRETEDALAKVKERLEGQAAKTPWSDWSKQVSTIITDLSKNIAATLFDGDLSWAEKGKKVLGDLGQAVMRSFVEPATKAIGDFIAGALSDLIGGKGFGGVLDRVKDIGGAFGGVFGGGGGSGAAGGAASSGGAGIPGTVGGGGGAAGAAAGAGLNATLGTIFGGIGAAAGVASFIQGFQVEKGLDAIEKETRYSQIHLGYILENTNKWLPYLEGIHKGVLEFRSDISWMVAEINDRSRFALDHLGEIAKQVTRSADRLLDNYSITEQVRDAIRERGAMNVTINVSGAGSPQATADAIALRLRTQGAFA